MNSNDWERRYQAHDTHWDKGRAHPEIVRWVSGQAALGRVFVPGCGTGHDVRVVAEKADEVIGLDFAPSAISGAKQFPQVRKEQFVIGDFFQPDPSWIGHFDWIIEHTLFCAIPIERRKDYVESCYQLLRPGGKVFAIFFLDPGIPLEEGPPFGSSWEEVQRLFSKHFAVLETWVPKETFPDRPTGELVAILEKEG